MGYKESFNIARRKILNADTMLNITYKITNDARLLAGVLENLYNGLNELLNSLLLYETEKGNNIAVPESIDAKLAVIGRVFKKYGIDVIYLMLIENVKDAWMRRKRSPIEIAKKKEFIMFEEDYTYEKLDYLKVRTMLIRSKKLLDQISKILGVR